VFEMRVMTLVSVAVFGLGVTGCTGPAVVNTDETATPPAAVAPGVPSSTRPSNAHLVDAFDYAARVDDATAYYFTTPSGRWACAIVPRTKAGCVGTAGWQSGLGIEDAPDTVPTADGESSTPNAIVVDHAGDAHFAALEQPEFSLADGTANVLQFDKVLAAAGFRCNVQEQSGVSCQSELTGKGFTFSDEGHTFRYTDLPA
jgi:hypothetical protein